MFDDIRKVMLYTQLRERQIKESREVRKKILEKEKLNEEGTKEYLKLRKRLVFLALCRHKIRMKLGKLRGKN